MTSAESENFRTNSQIICLGTNLLDTLSDDELIKAVSYLWFSDLYKAGIAFKRIWLLIKCNQTKSHLVCSLHKLFWYKTIYYKTDKNNIHNVMDLNSQKLVSTINNTSKIFDNQVKALCSKFSRWPIDIDTLLLIKDLEDVTALVPSHISTCVSYTGNLSIVQTYV